MMTLRSMLTVLLPHSIPMVHAWIIHGLESRMYSRSIVIA